MGERLKAMSYQRPGYRVVSSAVNLDGQATRLAVFHVPAVADVRLSDAPQGARPPEKAGEDDVKAVLLRAGETLKRMEMPREVANLGRVVQAWEVVRDRSDHGAWDKELEQRRRPTRDERAEVDLVLEWLLRVGPDERTVVWGFMSGLGVRRIARELGGNRSKSTVHRILRGAIRDILSM